MALDVGARLKPHKILSIVLLAPIRAQDPTDGRRLASRWRYHTQAVQSRLPDRLFVYASRCRTRWRSRVPQFRSGRPRSRSRWTGRRRCLN